MLNEKNTNIINLDKETTQQLNVQSLPCKKKFLLW